MHPVVLYNYNIAKTDAFSVTAMTISEKEKYDRAMFGITYKALVTSLDATQHTVVGVQNS